MAFSTQREFLLPEDLNRNPNLSDDTLRQNSLKSYASCTDPRGWSMSEKKRTGYLMDMLKDKRWYEPNGENDSYEEVYNLELDPRPKIRESSTDDDLTDRTDSLIFGAHAKLKDIEKAVDDVDRDVKREYEIKEEKPRPFKIGHQSSKRKDKLKSLSDGAKTTPDLEVKLLKGELERLQTERKQYKKLIKENAHLKKEITSLKLSEQIEPKGVKVKAEKENLINESLSRRDKDILDEVVKERDRLRDQIKRMAEVEPKIAELRERTIEAEKLEAERDNLKLWFTELTKKYRDLKEGSEKQIEPELDRQLSKDLVKSKVENDILMKKLSSYENIKRELDFYKNHYNQLFTELSKFRDQLQGRFSSQYELFSTKRKLCRAENTIQGYEQQMEQLLDHLRELSGAFNVMYDLYENVKNLTILCLSTFEEGRRYGAREDRQKMEQKMANEDEYEKTKTERKTIVGR